MNAIVAVDSNWAIGKDGNLLFSLPSDMKYFRSKTLNGTVILGRKTLESFPNGKPLPKRRNIVITSSASLVPPEAEACSSPAAAVALAGGADSDDLWVIGGGSVYTALIRQCKRAFVTKVDATVDDADTFFPNIDHLPGWEAVSVSEPITENGLTFRFVEYLNTRI